MTTLARAQEANPDDPWTSAPDARGAEASAPQPFGAPGELVLSGGLGIDWATWDSSDAAFRSVALGAELDYFFVRNVSIGLSVDLGASDTRGYGADGSLVETKSTLISAGPVLGVNIPLGERFSFYSRLTLGVHRGTQTESLVSGRSLSIAASPTGSAELTRFGPWGDLFTPVLLHASQHVYFGVGPRLYHDFARAQGGPDVGAERTTIGGRLELGGHWGGTEPSLVTEQGREPVVRFGERGQIVITNEIDVSGGYSGYSGTLASNGFVRVSPGADYFTSKHVAIGGTVSASYSRSVGLEPAGQYVSARTTTEGFSMRAGYDAPLGDSVSLFPRVSLGFDAVSHHQTAGATTSNSSSNGVWVSLYVPLLVHLSGHWFVGGGPTVTQELSRRYASGTENRATHLTATTVLGGWF